MKIIHIAGFSNSGKTTFILDLIPALAIHGKVGTIKHLGHHLYATGESGIQKDTSRFFDVNAHFVAGIDAEKTVITTPCNSLADIAAFYSDVGVEYAIIEGFKTLHCKKIWFGTREQAEEIGIAAYCFLWNPTVADIIQNLDAFETWHRTFFDGYVANKPIDKMK
jgi:molybdopterin-guanine dinucleotide biosynthesis protein MobB